MRSDVGRHLDAWLSLPWRQRMRWLRRCLASAASRRVTSADRELLEQHILPAYAARPGPQTVLFVGCDWYTQHYARLFDAATTAFCTLDIDPRKRRYGAARHIQAAVQDLASHVGAGSLDVVICNGVLGFGLNDRASFEAAMRACLHSLRAGGELVLGWNNIRAYAPFDPSEVLLELGFERCIASPLGRWRVEADTPTRHTFDTYRRRT